VRRKFSAILSKYFVPSIDAVVCEKIADAQVALDVALPFYVEPPSDERLIAEGLLDGPASETGEPAP
jgi:hypothetical protein